jgi:glycosyltransferase involved in cell wall biosynthesis
MPHAQPPLVSVGIPTYNRARCLGRAVESLRQQDHSRLEIVIADNASTDATEALCRELAAREPRLRYIRQPVNRGPTANFNTVLAEARGDFFMWLSDDDWLDANYLSECLKALLQHPGASMVAGQCRFYDEHSTFMREDPPTTLAQPTPPERVLAYYATVDYNSIFYGLMPLRLVRQTPMLNALANDWILVSNMAIHGSVITIPTTRVHRTVGAGASRTVKNVVRVAGLPSYQARMARLTVTFNASRALLRAPWPQSISSFARARVALLTFFILLVRYSWFRRLIPRRLRNALTLHFS